MKVIEMTEEEFKRLINQIKELKKENQKLIKANEFLNAQIEDYNNNVSKGNK